MVCIPPEKSDFYYIQWIKVGNVPDTLASISDLYTYRTKSFGQTFVGENAAKVNGALPELCPYIRCNFKKEAREQVRIFLKKIFSLGQYQSNIPTAIDKIY